MPSAEAPSILQLIGDLFWLALVLYLAYYLVVFVRPLWALAPRGVLDADLSQLSGRLRNAVEVADGPDSGEQRREALLEELRELGRRVEAEAAVAATCEMEGQLEEAGRIRNGLLPDLERRMAEVRDDLRTCATDARRAATARLFRLEALSAEYAHPFVAQAVAQVRARYPRGDYTRFEVGSIPAVADFAERFTAARAMAGAFVLLGLLGTLLKLNGVVGNIGRLTGESEMAPEAFLDRMGAMMGGLGGAFENSIIGVFLMVLSLLYLGWLNAHAQAQVARLDHAVAQEVLPILTELHERYMPEQTLADLLNSAGEHLDALNTTVGGLTAGMGIALTGLRDRIGEMLQQFGSFQRHYTMMNEWVKTLGSTTDALRAAAERMVGSAARLATPVDEMNAVLRAHLSAQTQERDPDRVERVLEEIRLALETGRADDAARVHSLVEGSHETLRRQLEASRTQIDAVTEECRGIERQMEAVAHALHAASNVRIVEVLDRFDHTADSLWRGLDRSAESLRDAAHELQVVSRSPTLFAWLTTSAWPALVRRVRLLASRTPRDLGMIQQRPVGPDGGRPVTIVDVLAHDPAPPVRPSLESQPSPEAPPRIAGELVASATPAERYSFSPAEGQEEKDTPAART